MLRWPRCSRTTARWPTGGQASADEAGERTAPGERGERRAIVSVETENITGAGPVQETGEIFDITRVGSYLQFTVIAPGVARAFQPGQFVAVAVGGPRTSMLLRRSFALYGVKPGGEFAGTIQFVVA